MYPVFSGCQGEAPPPYTLRPSSDTKSGSGQDGDSDNASNELFDNRVNPIYESPSQPREGATAAEASELPIKSTLRQSEGMD